MPITIDGSGTITGAATLATTVANPTFTTPNINSAQFATVSGTAPIYPCGTAKIVGGTGGQNVRIHNDAYATSVTTTALKIQVTNAANAAVADSEMVNIAIHR